MKIWRFQGPLFLTRDNQLAIIQTLLASAYTQTEIMDAYQYPYIFACIHTCKNMCELTKLNITSECVRTHTFVHIYIYIYIYIYTYTITYALNRKDVHGNPYA